MPSNERLSIILNEAVFVMPPDRENIPGVAVVELHYHTYGVTKMIAEAHKKELIRIIRTFEIEEDKLNYQSFRLIWRFIGSKHFTLKLIAIGKVLGFWDVITPEVHGLTGADADLAADDGYIAINGFYTEGIPETALKHVKAEGEEGEYLLFTMISLSKGQCIKCGNPWSEQIWDTLLDSLVGWVSSEEVAKKIVAMFGYGAKYIYDETDTRTHIININSCHAEKWRLIKLAELINTNSLITVEKIAKALE